MSEQERSETVKQAQMSAALVRDIVKRHLYPDYKGHRKACNCGGCQKVIPVGVSAYWVKNFDRSFETPLCSRDCLDAHEYQEIEYFYCAQLESLPPAEKNAPKMKRAELLEIYTERRDARKQDYIDKMADFRNSFQQEELPAD